MLPIWCNKGLSQVSHYYYYYYYDYYYYYHYYKSCKAPVKMSPPTKQHQAFYMLDAL